MSATACFIIAGGLECLFPLVAKAAVKDGISAKTLMKMLVGKPRLIELKQGLSPGPLGLTDYLDRLEQAARQQ
jgi:hypothetical protein